jgi:hypothetical protein
VSMCWRISVLLHSQIKKLLIWSTKNNREMSKQWTGFIWLTSAIYYDFSSYSAAYTIANWCSLRDTSCPALLLAAVMMALKFETDMRAHFSMWKSVLDCLGLLIDEFHLIRVPYWFLIHLNQSCSQPFEPFWSMLSSFDFYVFFAFLDL